MKRSHAESAAVIAAAPELIYAILADYRNEHPRILPKPEFVALEVVSGGIGAGTETRITMRVAGIERVLRQRVEEPEPGRVLREYDLDADMATTFTVTPHAEGAHVRIETDWAPRNGLSGKVEAWLTRQVMRSLYARELRQLAGYAAEKQARV